MLERARVCISGLDFGYSVLSLTRRRMICATVVPSRRLFLSSDTPIIAEADRQNGLVNVSHSGVWLSC